MRVLIVLLLIVPMAQATISNPDGDHEAVLHIHLNGQQEMQLSPLAPPAWVEHDRSPGAIAQSGCIETPGQGLTNQQLHTWYGIVAPGLVRYDDAGRTEPLTERGIRDDLQLADQPWTLEWFMRTNTPDQQGVAPRVILEATVREGDDISVDDAALNSGRIVARAQTEDADLSPALSGHPHVSYDSAANLYRFRLPLPPQSPLVVPQSESFNLRVDVYTRHPYCDTTERYAMPDLVNIVSLPEYRPTLTLGVRNPVSIDRVSAVVDDDLVRFQADVRAVFGSGDALLTDGPWLIQGPSEALTVSETSWGEGPEEDGRAFPVRAGASYQGLHAWAYPADEAASGEYNATLVLRTSSGAEARATVPFGLGSSETSCTVLATGEPSCAIEAKSDKRTPAPFPLALLAVALLRRR